LVFGEGLVVVGRLLCESNGSILSTRSETAGRWETVRLTVEGLVDLVSVSRSARARALVDGHGADTDALNAVDESLENDVTLDCLTCC